MQNITYKMQNNAVKTPLQQSGTLTREIKITLLKSLKQGYFDSSAMEQMKCFLFPNGEPLTIEIIDRTDQVRK